MNQLQRSAADRRRITEYTGRSRQATGTKTEPHEHIYQAVHCKGKSGYRQACIECPKVLKRRKVRTIMHATVIDTTLMDDGSLSVGVYAPPIGHIALPGGVVRQVKLADVDQGVPVTNMAGEVVGRVTGIRNDLQGVKVDIKLDPAKTDVIGDVAEHYSAVMHPVDTPSIPKQRNDRIAIACPYTVEELAKWSRADLIGLCGNHSVHTTTKTTRRQMAERIVEGWGK